MRLDPRVRQSLDNFSNSLDSAADSARAGCFTFTTAYIQPCLSSLSTCCTSCLPSARRRHPHRTPRTEYPFGFYSYEYEDDSSSDDESRGFLAWGTDELDRLLAGSGREGMHYGAPGSSSSAGVGRKNKQTGAPGMRRTSTLPRGGEEGDPTIIPTTNQFGFLGWFGMRGKGMRYKPSAANLQENPQRGMAVAKAGRKRSGTGGSGSSQQDSIRSRGDLWPSSEEEDDAVIIGDEILRSDDEGEGAREGRLNSILEGLDPGLEEEELRAEEERLRHEEEEEIRLKREKARRLALEKGLSSESVNMERTQSSSTKEADSIDAARALSASPPPQLIRAASPRPDAIEASTSQVFPQYEEPPEELAKQSQFVPAMIPLFFAPKDTSEDEQGTALSDQQDQDGEDLR